MGPRTLRWIASLAFALGLGSAARAEDRAPAPVPAPSPPPPARTSLTLDRAVAQGLLDVGGASPSSYESVLLVLQSRSKDPLLLDVSGRHLEPTTGNVQRLGLSFPTTPTEPGVSEAPGSCLLELGPGERREIRMNSCCMDAGRACPRSGDRYVLAKAPPPPAVEVALRWWVDHREAPQGFVNAAIWQHDPALLEHPPTAGDGRAAPSAWPKGRAVRSYRGILYLLDDGALTSVDPEGVRRFHATGIHQVFPQADGLLAIGRSAAGRELWRFGVTGDPPWSRVFSVESADLGALYAVPGGAFVVGRAAGLSFRASKDVPEGAIELRDRENVEARGVDFGVVDLEKGRGVAFVYKKGQPRGGPISDANVRERAPKVAVYDVDLKDGTSKLRKTFWNVRHLGAGPAGVFALTPNGQLERLEGEHLQRLPSEHDWVRVVAVGAERLLLQAEGDALFAHELKSGRDVALPPGAKDVSIDPVTDDLVWIAGDAAARWAPGRTEPETIPVR